MLRLRPIARFADDCAALSTTDFRLRGNYSCGKGWGFTTLYLPNRNNPRRPAGQIHVSHGYSGSYSCTDFSAHFITP